MNKTLLYFIIAIALGAAVYFITRGNSSGSYKNSDKDFAVKDTANIGKIFIADMQGETITLERKENEWVVNGNIPARPESILTILRTLAQIEVTVPVSESMQQNVVKALSTENIKVEVYTLKGKKIKTYFIGKPNMNYKGNFALMDGSRHPFIINIPGFDGVISTRYSTDLYNWKSRSVFHDDVNSISRISVQYPKLPDSSFVIQKNANGVFELENKSGFNPEITKYFASQFLNINCENYILDKYKIDSLKSVEPVCIFSLTTNKNITKEIKIFYRPVTYRTKMQFTYEGKEINFDLDKFYCLMNQEQDLAIIQNFVFGKLFIGPQYFYRQRPSNKNVLIDAMMGQINQQPN